MYMLRYKDTTRTPKVPLTRRIADLIRNLMH